MREESFLEASPGYANATTIDYTDRRILSALPSVPYKLLEQLGEGGFEALLRWPIRLESRSAVQSRASRCSSRGWMTLAKSSARFEAERQALGDHGSSQHRHGFTT